MMILSPHWVERACFHPFGSTVVVFAFLMIVARMPLMVQYLLSY